MRCKKNRGEGRKSDNDKKCTVYQKNGGEVNTVI
jgi:hypothetical protein